MPNHEFQPLHNIPMRYPLLSSLQHSNVCMGGMFSSSTYHQKQHQRMFMSFSHFFHKICALFVKNFHSEKIQFHLLFSTLRRGFERKSANLKNFYFFFVSRQNHRFHLGDNRRGALSLVIFILNWIRHKFLISKNIKLFWCMLLFHCHKLTTFCLLFVCYLCRCIRLFSTFSLFNLLSSSLCERIFVKISWSFSLLFASFEFLLPKTPFWRFWTENRLCFFYSLLCVEE